MDNADKFMQEEFLPFCKRASDAFEQNHSALFAAFKSFLSGQTLLGMRLTENATILGDYTIVLEDGKFTRIDNGVLTSAIHTPFGVIKPYYILEVSTVKQMIEDEQSFIAHPFATKLKYLSEVTIKFLK